MLEIFSADEGRRGGARFGLATEADAGAAPLQQVSHMAAACCAGRRTPSQHVAPSRSMLQHAMLRVQHRVATSRCFLQDVGPPEMPAPTDSMKASAQAVPTCVVPLGPSTSHDVAFPDRPIGPVSRARPTSGRALAGSGEAASGRDRRQARFVCLFVWLVVCLFVFVIEHTHASMHTQARVHAHATSSPCDTT